VNCQKCGIKCRFATCKFFVNSTSEFVVNALPVYRMYQKESDEIPAKSVEKLHCGDSGEAVRELCTVHIENRIKML
jgi:hypothetical protein